MSQIDDTIATQLTALAVEGKRPRTIASYDETLRAFRRADHELALPDAIGGYTVEHAYAFLSDQALVSPVVGELCASKAFEFAATLKGSVVTSILAPQANALAELVIGTIRRDLDHLIVVNERHLCRVLGQYIASYNTARLHRSLGLWPPSAPSELPSLSARNRIVVELYWEGCLTSTVGPPAERWSFRAPQAWAEPLILLIV